MIDPTYAYGLAKNISASGLIFTGGCAVVGVIVSSHTNGTLKIWDSLTAANTVVIDTFTFPAGSGVYSFFGAKCNIGLYVTVGGTFDGTIIYQPYQG